MDKFCSAAILAGGRSTRMGFDKQLLTIDDRYIFESNLEQLNKEFDDIIVVTNTPELYASSDIRTASDTFRGVGPLAGLHAALSISESEYVYLVACDMPVMNMKYAAYLKSRLTASPADVCASRIGGRIETFNAFYSVKMLHELESVLSENAEKGGHSPGIYDFITHHDISLNIAEENEVRLIDPELDMFINLNTQPEYMEFIKKRIR
jgi:molybdopterin-guanine dinucleotide biosynthesis protein A